MTVGERIQAYRKEVGLSQEELGQRLLVSRQTVSLWETGQTLPTIDNLMRLREIFGVSVDDLLFSTPQAASTGQKAPSERYALQKMPATHRKWLLAACLLSLLHLAVSVAVSVIRLPHSPWGGVFITLSLLVASTLTIWLLASKRYAIRTKNNTFTLAIYAERLLLIRREGTDTEKASAFPLRALQDVTADEELVRFRLGKEHFCLPCNVIAANSPLLTSAIPHKRLSALPFVCIFLALLTLISGVFLLPQDIVGDPVRRAARIADIALPTAEAAHITKTEGYEGDIFVYYRAELYFAEAYAKNFESSLLTDSRWLSDLPYEKLANCIPPADRHYGANYYLLYDRESKSHVMSPQAADDHRYILFSYFEKENMLYIAEFRCTHK